MSVSSYLPRLKLVEITPTFFRNYTSQQAREHRRKSGTQSRRFLFFRGGEQSKLLCDDSVMILL